MKANLSNYITKEGEKIIENFYIEQLSNWPIPYEEHYIDTDYGKTYILTGGNKEMPSLILLHGATNNSILWKDNIEELSKHYYTIGIDLVGDIGRSRLTIIPKDFSDYSKWLEQILNSLNINKATFMGASLGGALSIYMAYSYPERVEKVYAFVPAAVILKTSFKFMLKAITTFISFNEKKLNSYTSFLNGGNPISNHMKDMSHFMFKSIKAGNSSIWSPAKMLSYSEIENIKVTCCCYLAEKDPLYKAEKVKKKINSLNCNVKVDIIKGQGHLLKVNYLDYI